MPTVKLRFAHQLTGECCAGKIAQLVSQVNSRSNLPAMQQFFRFLFTGGLATVLQYSVLWLGVENLAFSAARASGLGYLAGSALSYFMNYFFTFRSKRSHLHAAPSFYLMVAIGWCINTGIMAVTADELQWSYWLCQIFATGLTLVWNFAASRNLIFKTA